MHLKFRGAFENNWLLPVLIAFGAFHRIELRAKATVKHVPATYALQTNEAKAEGIQMRSPPILPLSLNPPQFDHKEAKLIQSNIRDEDETLIAPGELYSQVVEEILFCTSISFDTFLYRGSKGRDMQHKPDAAVDDASKEFESPKIPTLQHSLDTSARDILVSQTKYIVLSFVSSSTIYEVEI
ncbi:hypothetical protein B0H11DRAFT_1900027 [Mycena galericulata]|nr:hypothetical protein B0H11DRAFT_1900027 [Mycena galericulata]